MSWRIRFTEEAAQDLERLQDFLLECEPPDIELATRALDADRNALALLAHTPYTCRKARPDTPFLQELVIPFGSSGDVALFEIGKDTVTVLAVRHQREDDYR